MVKAIIILSSKVPNGATSLLSLDLGDARKLILNPVRECQAVVHITSLLELALALKPDLVSKGSGARDVLLLFSFGGFGYRLRLAKPAEEGSLFLLRGSPIWKASCVPNSNFPLVLLAGFRELGLDALHSVIVDENRSTATFFLVVLDSGEDTHHSWYNDTVSVSATVSSD